MRCPEYEKREKEAEERLFKKGAYILIATCHSLSLIQWTCYLMGGSWWGG